MGRPDIEIADVFNRFGARFFERFGAYQSAEQFKAFNAIIRCRTAAMGGFMYRCSGEVGCGFEQPQYRSCLNRHCPRCQGSARARWLDARMEELLPVGYFHLVFTLPPQLRDLALHNKRAIYGLLFRAAADALLKIGRDPKHLGAQLGFFGVLHTWGQTLGHHPHVHFLVPGGGLSEDGTKWVEPRSPDYLLPVKVLSPVFRGMFMQGLERLYARGELRFHGRLQSVADPVAFQALKEQAVRKPWVVYAKRPFSGPSVMLRYLARYTHRVAVTGHRILSMDEEGVELSYKDYRDRGTRKALRLTGPEFIRRVLMHVVPSGFQRIRYYGFLSPANRKISLPRIRALLGGAEPAAASTEPCAETESVSDEHRPSSDLVPRCPRCDAGEWLAFLRLSPVAPMLRGGPTLEEAPRPVANARPPPAVP